MTSPFPSAAHPRRRHRKAIRANSLVRGLYLRIASDRLLLLRFGHLSVREPTGDRPQLGLGLDIDVLRTRPECLVTPFDQPEAVLPENLRIAYKSRIAIRSGIGQKLSVFVSAIMRIGVVRWPLVRWCWPRAPGGPPRTIAAACPRHATGHPPRYPQEGRLDRIGRRPRPPNRVERACDRLNSSAPLDGRGAPPLPMRRCGCKRFHRSLPACASDLP